MLPKKAGTLLFTGASASLRRRSGCVMNCGSAFDLASILRQS